MFFVGDHVGAKIEKLNGKTNKGRFFNGNKVILCLH
jgi:hypothetical protein